MDGMERGGKGGKSVPILVSIALQYNECMDSRFNEWADGWEVDTWMT